MNVLDLTESNPTRCAFRFYAKEKLVDLSDPKNLVYEPDPRGLREAREAVCRYYAEKKMTVVPEQIFLTSSTSEAYGFLFRLLADPGDEILCAEPSYPLFETLAELNDVRLKKFSLVYHDSWRMDQVSLERLFTARTKALMVVHPNNPTGHFVTGQERGILQSRCVQNGCALIVDEVFLDYAWGLDREEPSFAGQTDVLTFTLSGISKLLGLPQMKLSWIVVSGPESQRMEALEKLELISDAHLSVNTPSQRALPGWMNGRQAVLDEIRMRLRSNFQFLENTFRDHRASRLLKTEGGWYAVLKNTAGLGDEAFTVELLRKKNVLLHPGFFFDFPEDDHWVLSLLTEPSVFREGVQRLGEYAAGDYNKVK